MKRYRKQDFPVAEIRRFLEPGPIVMVSSAWKGEKNIMIMGWHMVMEFTPSLVGCIISNDNHSFELIRRSEECVINIPELHLGDVVAGVGTTTGGETDKFAEFGLTPMPGEAVGAPLIAECHSSFECKLADASLIDKYSMFVFEVVKAHVAPSPRFPKTIHYRGDGLFMVAGRTISLKDKLRRELP
jgi:flavin reductase (DIM6/NTAB) family NADH-FMN oxidoreductase RutF